ncbi:MAG: SEC-C metal-binding domain-containing protein, partial [Gaiellaceae bacterium]
AQKKVEEQNFVSRKNVLKYDDVMNVQRQVIYEQRRRVLEGDDLSDEIHQWIDEVLERAVLEHTASEYPEEWDLDSLFKEIETIYDTEVRPDEIDLKSMSREELIEDFADDAHTAYETKEEELGSELMREIERFLILQVVDLRWREHLDSMEYLRDGIHLRAMAQKDPLVEYRSEGHTMFEELGAIIREEVVRHLFHVELQQDEAEQLQPARAPEATALSYEHESLAGADAIAAAGGNGSGNGQAVGAGVTAGGIGGGATSVATGQRTVSAEQKVGRNDPCWCGSGKKYKKCHGA